MCVLDHSQHSSHTDASVSGVAAGPVSLPRLVFTTEGGVLRAYVLVVVLLLLLSPVLVELVDLHCCVTLLKQVKGLKQKGGEKIYIYHQPVLYVSGGTI